MLKFINPKELVNLLRDGQLPPFMQVVLLAILFLIQCLFGRPGLVGPLASPTTFPFALFQLGIVLATLWIGYRANGGSKGQDFINRYVTLGSVLYLWVYVGGYAIYIVAYWVAYSAIGSTAAELFRHFGPAQLVFAAVSSLLFIFLLQHYLSKLAGNVPT